MTDYNPSVASRALMDDTDKHERIEPGLHHEVIEWVSKMCKAARHFKRAPEVIRDFDRLLAMARGEWPALSERVAVQASEIEPLTDENNEDQR